MKKLYERFKNLANGPDGFILPILMLGLMNISSLYKQYTLEKDRNNYRKLYHEVMFSYVDLQQKIAELLNGDK